MKIMFRVLGAVAILVACGSTSSAQQKWDANQTEILNAIDSLSAATAPGGGGADAYAAILAKPYSRWTMGDTFIDDKESMVASIRDWLESGWTVTDHKSNALNISVKGVIAFVRRIVSETYTGPDGKTSSATTALAEVWTQDEGKWLLMRVDATPMGSGEE